MKKVVSVTEVEGEGLTALLGERVLVMCGTYFYDGVLEGVNDTCILLTDASIVFDTGSLTARKYTTAEKLPDSSWYIQTATIESFGKSGK